MTGNGSGQSNAIGTAVMDRGTAGAADGGKTESNDVGERTSIYSQIPT